MSVERDRPDWRPPWPLPVVAGSTQPARATDTAAGNAFARSLQRAGAHDPSVVGGKPGERAGGQGAGTADASARGERSAWGGLGEPARDLAADERRGNARAEARRAGHEQAGRERAALEGGRDRDSGSRAISSRRAPADEVSDDGDRHHRSFSEACENAASPQPLPLKSGSANGGRGEHRQAPEPERVASLPTPIVPSPAVAPTVMAPVATSTSASVSEPMSFVPAQATATLAQLLDRLVHPPAAADAPWRLQLETRDASLGVVHLEHRPESGWCIAVQPRDPGDRRASPEQLAELGTALRERGHRVSSVEQLSMDGMPP